MEKGINIPHLFKQVNLKQKMLLIKQAGFDILMPTLDPNHEVLMHPIDEVRKYSSEIGLKLEYGHAPYKEPEIQEFWYDNKVGQEIENTYYKTIDIAHQFGMKVIICHLHFGTNYKLSEVGLNRLKRLANYAQQKDIIIAIENLYSYDEPSYIFNHIHHPNLKMCFDSGHEHFLTPKANFLKQFHNEVVALHLHDNNGIIDEHKSIFTGSIDWDYITSGIAMLNNVPLTLEVKPIPKITDALLQKEELKVILKKEFESLLKLEQLVLDKRKTYDKRKII